MENVICIRHKVPQGFCDCNKNYQFAAQTNSNSTQPQKVEREA